MKQRDQRSSTNAAHFSDSLQIDFTTSIFSGVEKLSEPACWMLHCYALSRNGGGMRDGMYERSDGPDAAHPPTGASSPGGRHPS
eukprot:4852297-Pyramimonas_sp.AAC.1